MIAPIVRRFVSSVPNRINFESHAFADKSTLDILRTLTILGMCSFQGFVDNSLWIMERSRRYLGGYLVDSIARGTFYKQFVGGDRPENIRKVVEKLQRSGIRPMLVCTMEEDVGHQKSNEGLYDRNLKRVLGCLDLTRSIEAPSPTMQLKMTSLMSADLLVQLSRLFLSNSNKQTMVTNFAGAMSGEGLRNVIGLTPDELQKMEKGLGRLQHIGQIACQNNIKVLIDAEYTYVNPAISLLALVMMLHFNKQEPRIWNTYQCYLKKTLSDMERDWNLATALQVCFGVKLVRGAYIALEKSRAATQGHPDPICDSYEDTNSNYNKVLGVLLDKIRSESQRLNLVIATHNEESIQFAISRMQKLNIDGAQGGVHFAQLYGMCDQVTYPLAAVGYATYKSVPYGPLEEALPYLARRAVENRSVLAGARKEQQLLRKELMTRVGFK